MDADAPTTVVAERMSSRQGCQLHAAAAVVTPARSSPCVCGALSPSLSSSRRRCRRPCPDPFPKVVRPSVSTRMAWSSSSFSETVRPTESMSVAPVATILLLATGVAATATVDRKTLRRLTPQIPLGEGDVGPSSSATWWGSRLNSFGAHVVFLV